MEKCNGFAGLGKFKEDKAAIGGDLPPSSFLFYFLFLVLVFVIFFPFWALFIFFMIYYALLSVGLYKRI